MSRVTEILRRYPPGYFDQFEKPPIPEPLFPMFARVFNIIESSLEETPPDGIVRKIQDYNWDGADFGAHDHKGTITGTSDGISLDIKIKGSTFDNQRDIGEIWKLLKYHQQSLLIEGLFISSNSRIGYISLVRHDGAYDYKAFWLKNSNETLKLRQVVNLKGETFDATKLKVLHGQITIPQTHISIPISKTS